VLLVKTSSSTAADVLSCRWRVQLATSSGDRLLGSPYADARMERS
jgi:hypothetical protein